MTVNARDPAKAVINTRKLSEEISIQIEAFKAAGGVIKKLGVTIASVKIKDGKEKSRKRGKAKASQITYGKKINDRL